MIRHGFLDRASMVQRHSPPRLSIIKKTVSYPPLIPPSPPPCGHGAGGGGAVGEGGRNGEPWR